MFWCEHIYVAFSTIYVGYLTLRRKSAYLRRKKISCCSGWIPGHYNMFLGNPLRFHFPSKTKSLVTFPKLQIITVTKYWNLKVSHFCKIGRTFFWSKPVTLSIDCSRLGDALYFVLSSSTVLNASSVAALWPQDLGKCFCSKIFHCLLEEILLCPAPPNLSSQVPWLCNAGTG